MTTEEFEQKIKRVLITEEEIQAKVREVGAQISREYEGKPLSDYLYIDHQTDASLGAQMARWRYENGVTGDTGSFEVDNITACLEMVKRGLGWALMPEIALDNFDGCVRPCTFENGEPFLRRTYIFCQRDAAALPQVQLFMDMLKKKR